MKKPFRKNISQLLLEGAHNGSGSRKLILSQNDEGVSTQLEAVTKGFLSPGFEFDWHNHLGIDEFWIVIQGEGTIEYKDGTVFEYKRDDVIYNPSELEHKIIAKGNEESTYYFVRLKA